MMKAVRPVSLSMIFSFVSVIPTQQKLIIQLSLCGLCHIDYSSVAKAAAARVPVLAVPYRTRRVPLGGRVGWL